MYDTWIMYHVSPLGIESKSITFKWDKKSQENGRSCDRGAMKPILILENVREAISQMSVAQLFGTEISPREVYSLIVYSATILHGLSGQAKRQSGLAHLPPRSEQLSCHPLMLPWEPAGGLCSSLRHCSLAKILARGFTFVGDILWYSSRCH